MTLPEFFSSLAATYGSSMPASSAIAYMRRRLDAEGLSSSALGRLHDYVQDKCQYHPIWEGLTDAIDKLGLRDRKPTRSSNHWITFKDARGRPYCMRCADPSNPEYHRLPAWALCVHLVVDNPVLDLDPDALLSAAEIAQASLFDPTQLILEVVESIGTTDLKALPPHDPYEDL